MRILVIGDHVPLTARWIKLVQEASPNARVWGPVNERAALDDPETSGVDQVWYFLDPPRPPLDGNSEAGVLPSLYQHAMANRHAAVHTLVVCHGLQTLVAEDIESPAERSSREWERVFAGVCVDKGLRWRIFRTGYLFDKPDDGEGLLDHGLNRCLVACASLAQEIVARLPSFFNQGSLTLPASLASPKAWSSTDGAAEALASLLDRTDGDKVLIRAPVPLDVTEAMAAAVAPWEGKLTFADSGGPLAELYQALTRHSRDELGFEPDPDWHLIETGNGPVPRPSWPPPIQRELSFQSVAPPTPPPEDAYQSVVSEGRTLYYRRAGEGPALFLINAFGLSAVFWEPLLEQLKAHYRVLIWCERDARPPHSGLNTVYYSVDSYREAFLAGARAIWKAEGVTQCHLVSWCSGAKLAMELAVSEPERVASLIMLTPSFPGVTGFEGFDSDYEKSLEKMCGIVKKMPQTAGSMAQSMQGLKRKGASGDNLDGLLGLVPATWLDLLYQPFDNAENMRLFSEQLVHFRAHDVAELIAAVQQPVLCLTASHDTATSAARGQLLARKMAKVACLNWIGGSHYLLVQYPHLLKRILAAFIESGVSLHAPLARLDWVHRQESPAPTNGVEEWEF